MHKALHPRDDMNRLCQEKNKEEDSLALKISIIGLEDYIKK